MSKRGVTAILFDLDGTLVDSLPGIEASIRRAVELCCPGRTLPDIRSSIGPPIKVMLARLWPEIPEDQLQQLVAAFRQHYDSEGCRQSRLFDGVNQTLAKLEAQGIEMFVLTNKPSGPARTILELTGIARRFRAVVSPDSSDPPFIVKSAGALDLRRRFGLQADATLVVGDGTDDAEAAAVCGFGFVVAGYGYGSAIGREDLPARGTLKAFSDIEGIVL